MTAVSIMVASVRRTKKTRRNKTEKPSWVSLSYDTDWTATRVSVLTRPHNLPRPTRLQPPPFRSSTYLFDEPSTVTSSSVPQTFQAILFLSMNSWEMLVFNCVRMCKPLQTHGHITITFPATVGQWIEISKVAPPHGFTEHWPLTCRNSIKLVDTI